ncbi:MAG: glycosyltransferase family 4 protein [Planctomycetota bacterium]
MPRIVWLRRALWPQCGLAGVTLSMKIIDGLARLGHHVHAIGRREKNQWPTKMHFMHSVIHRPVGVASHDWTGNRFLRDLERYLKSTLESHDVLVVDGIRDEIIASVMASKAHQMPVVAIYRDDGLIEDKVYWQSSRNGRKIFDALLQVDALVTHNASTSRRLVAMGMPTEQVQQIVDGVPPKRLTLEAKSDVRRRLAMANGDLIADDDEQVLLVITPLVRATSIMDFVRLIPNILEANERLRIWIIGDGSLRDKVHRELCELGVRQRVAIPGVFADRQDLFDASDVVLQLGNVDYRDTLIECMAKEIPLIAPDYLALDCFESTRYVMDQPQSIAERVNDVLASYDEYNLPSKRQQAESVGEVSWHQTIEEWSSLLTTCVEKHLASRTKQVV